MVKQTEIEWRELEDGALEGVGGQYDFVISVIEAAAASGFVHLLLTLLVCNFRVSQITPLFAEMGA